MNFDYCNVSGTTAPAPITLLELAANVITDWMPGTPNSLSHGFVNLLAEILESKPIGTNTLWATKPQVANFEKQWKQVISWMLGVAFCRKVAEMEGYVWWAPVSAFTGFAPPGSISFTNWQPFYSVTNCEIIKPVPPLSKMMPDYVLARYNHTNSCHEVSFAESKGCRMSIETLDSPPLAWSQQSRNAEFYCFNTHYPARQNLVVATRVNPHAKREKNRRIFVRAWNSDTPANVVPFSALRDIMAIHYLGICEQIGLRANARLIAMSYTHIDPKDSQLDEPPFTEDEDYSEMMTNPKMRLQKLAREEIKYLEINRLSNEGIAMSSHRSSFAFGDKTIRIGLSSNALEIIKWLQGEEIPKGEDLIYTFHAHIDLIRSKIRDPENIMVRSDGIITEFIKEL